MRSDRHLIYGQTNSTGAAMPHSRAEPGVRGGEAAAAQIAAV